MFRRQLLRNRYSRNVHAYASITTRSFVRHHSLSLCVSLAVSAGAVWYSFTKPVFADAPPIVLPENFASLQGDIATGELDDGTITGVVWGSNKNNILCPDQPEVNLIQRPASSKWMQNVALRDLALHETHGACVDVRGDVYQWGTGFYGRSTTRTDKPHPTLLGKNIVKLQLTENRLFALSSSGKLYVLASSFEQQRPSEQSPTEGVWGLGSLGITRKAPVDYIELSTNVPLSWGEKFVSISAGRDHLLALTSSGRTFSYAINKKANSHGQLGYRKFTLPTLDPHTNSSTRIIIDLIPKIAKDPYSRASPFIRESSGLSGPLGTLDDQHLRFSDTLFQIQSLDGIKVSQIAAGSRSSFVLTDSGRALGFGANEYGQIGLGNNVTLDSITVPTEIILSRNVPPSTSTKCLEIAAGGDLTCFVAERSGLSTGKFVDVLVCGNGQWGGLGNNTFTNYQGNPTRARNISGLKEYNEKLNTSMPIVPGGVSISPTGHLLLNLGTQHEGSGRDLAVWGLNHDYQLGTGKKTSLAVPTMIEKPDGSRFMLFQKKALVTDLLGRSYGKVEVQQRAVAGYGSSVIYWKAC